MTMNVFYYHNGRIDKKSQRKDQGKKGDPVDSDSKKVIHTQGHCQNKGDTETNNQSLFYTKKQNGNDKDGNQRDSQMFNEYINAVVCLFSIIASDDNMDILRDKTGLHPLNPFQDIICNKDGIGARLFSDSHGYCWNFRSLSDGKVLVSRTKRKAAETLALYRWTINNLCNIFHKNRPALMSTDNQPADIFCSLQVTINKQAAGLSLVKE